ncbi:hypothetical protein [Deinococcus hopiensis]|nr:hypothetical protein [Deinococcus hopiensis]
MNEANTDCPTGDRPLEGRLRDVLQQALKRRPGAAVPVQVNPVG